MSTSASIVSDVPCTSAPHPSPRTCRGLLSTQLLAIACRLKVTLWQMRQACRSCMLPHLSFMKPSVYIGSTLHFPVSRVGCFAGLLGCRRRPRCIWARRAANSWRSGSLASTRERSAKTTQVRGCNNECIYKRSGTQISAILSPHPEQRRSRLKRDSLAVAAARGAPEHTRATASLLYHPVKDRPAILDRKSVV